ncbi:MAG: hypothetical protein K1X72_07950 [Pyrinomonadaceae bacterium]|nr:hypothetical protein [Pyrinomonadaceae bacterium]
MRKNCNVLLLISLTLICSKISFGQLVSEEYCKKVENIIATPFNPAYWYHNIAFSDECSFEFDIDKEGGVGISFSLEKSKTPKLAKKSLHSDIELYEYSKYKVTKEGEIIFLERKPKKISKNGFWDEAFAYENNYPMLLRKKRTYISIFCDKAELCLQIEKRLREVSVLGEF